mmetsp:Transcript_5924/g.9867  ORF Transcript_5924/g.9867 Transcript_5924/m.9867 type:complete len:342 (-) Transcript_5924:252-1277(-)|eukprot:CAMPEP_0119013688 /NCGR_PEP_ID=MMETSP1176-20130426/8757_1 /TAXON_ID=265551 /ORGANISM="Synedropsis recta cf, Strain CCMP1620" /LENGTH=341 /DNA_ID=CAMNT_0006966797 /DNA_START=124 /DNA_END=1149 /DNA_ORIENTATION=-
MEPEFKVQVAGEQQEKQEKDADFLQAIIGGRTEEVGKLLQNSTDKARKILLNKRDDDGFPPLLIASKLGHEEIVKRLLEYEGKGVDVNEEILPTTDPNSKDKALQDLKTTLAACGKSVQKIQRLRYTALLLASKHGHPRVVELLLNSGAKVNTCTGTSALRTASGFLHEECVRILLAHGADVSIRQPETGATALFSASMVGHVGIAKMLIQHGADVNNTVSGQRSTCLSIATFMKHADMMELLLKHGADPNRVNKDNMTALWVAVVKGNADMQKILLAHGAKATPGLLFGTTMCAGPATAMRMWKNRAWRLSSSLPSKQSSSTTTHSPLIEKEVAQEHEMS